MFIIFIFIYSVFIVLYSIAMRLRGNFFGLRKFEGATTRTPVRTQDPPEAFRCLAVPSSVLRSSFVRRSSVVLHLAKKFFFCFPVLPRPFIVTLHNHSIVKLSHAFVLHCLGAWSYLSPFLRRFAVACFAYVLLVCSAFAVVAVSASLALSKISRSGLSGSSAAPYLAAISAGVSCRSVACSMINF